MCSKCSFSCPKPGKGCKAIFERRAQCRHASGWDNIPWWLQVAFQRHSIEVRGASSPWSVLWLQPHVSHTELWGHHIIQDIQLLSLSGHKQLGFRGSMTDQLACCRNCNLQLGLGHVCWGVSDLVFILVQKAMSEWRGKNKTKHGAEVLVLGDASFQSHPFYESIYGPSFCVRHILGFQAGSKSNWTLTHHHKVKFVLEYLKLTKNIFDIKKQKDSITRSFRLCLMRSTCCYYYLQPSP